MRRIETRADLETLYGAPGRHRRVESRARHPARRSTTRKSARLRSSGDDGPVVRVQDDTTLLMPDWWGNNRLDCLHDIVADGRVALLFLVPGTNTTVRVNGRAMLTDDADLRQSFAKGDRLPTTVIVIEVAEVYTQCAKALLRSALWTCGDISEGLPTTGEILADMSGGEHGGTDYDRTYPEYAKPKMW